MTSPTQICGDWNKDPVIKPPGFHGKLKVIRFFFWAAHRSTEFEGEPSYNPSIWEMVGSHTYISITLDLCAAKSSEKRLQRQVEMAWFELEERWESWDILLMVRSKSGEKTSWGTGSLSTIIYRVYTSKRWLLGISEPSTPCTMWILFLHNFGHQNFTQKQRCNTLPKRFSC